ncbi:MAG: hypothetical protein PHC97_03050 [Patescibacteria group bacterium]|nr:hypothetical protein [Patescibacteria group bacterium]
MEKNIFIQKKESGNNQIAESDWAERYLHGFQARKQEHELEKSRELIKQIDEAITIVQELANNYGVNAFRIRAEAFHPLPHEDFIKRFGGAEEFNLIALSNKFGIFLDINNAKRLDLNNFMSLVHEILHTASIQKFELTAKGEQSHLHQYRSGFRLVNLDKENQANEKFIGLNEGITQFLTKSAYVARVKNLPKFFEAVDELEKNLSNDDKETKVIFPPACRAYQWLEKLFLDLCEKIFEKNKDKFKNFDEVRSFFIKIYFNGDINEAAKLIMTLAPGALRELSAIKQFNDKESLEKIKKFRKKYGLPEDQ